MLRLCGMYMYHCVMCGGRSHSALCGFQGSHSGGHQAWQQALVPAQLSCQPRRGHFNNCLIRLENVSFCFRKNQVVRGDIFDHFLAVNLDQMSVGPAALQQLTPRTMCHSASSFRIPATSNTSSRDTNCFEGFHIFSKAF